MPMSEENISAATAKHRRWSRAAVTVTERPRVGSTQTKSMIFTSRPQNLYSIQEGNIALEPVLTMPDRQQEGGFEQEISNGSIS